MTAPVPDPPIDAVTLLSEAREHLSCGDHRQVLAIAYPTVVRVGAAPGIADDEEWHLVTLYAIATAAVGDPARAVEHADAAYRGLLTLYRQRVAGRCRTRPHHVAALAAIDSLGVDRATCSLPALPRSLPARTDLNNPHHRRPSHATMVAIRSGRAL